MLRRLLLAAVMTAALLVVPSEAGAVIVCDEYYDDTLKRTIKVNCRDLPPADDDADNGSENKKNNKPREPMMWIRFGVYSAGEGFVGACQLVPVAGGVPSGYTRVTADDCGFETEARPSRDDVEAMVRSLQATLQVPTPTIKLGPDPSDNEWDMAVVGHPVWLWTDAPRTASSVNTGEGMTIAIKATLGVLSLDMGDGTTVSCTQWTPYDASVPAGTPSPTCGHTYEKASLPQGSYTVSATATWTAEWSAMGYTGTLPLRSTASREVPVGELQAVVVR